MCFVRIVFSVTAMLFLFCLFPHEICAFILVASYSTPEYERLLSLYMGTSPVIDHSTLATAKRSVCVSTEFGHACLRVSRCFGFSMFPVLLFSVCADVID